MSGMRESWSLDKVYPLLFLLHNGVIFIHNKLHCLFCSSKRVPIYKVSMEEARWGAVFPGKFVPVLTFEGKCSGFRAKTAYISGHLPSDDGRHEVWHHREHQSPGRRGAPRLRALARLGAYDALLRALQVPL